MHFKNAVDFIWRLDRPIPELIYNSSDNFCLLKLYFHPTKQIPNNNNNNNIKLFPELATHTTPRISEPSAAGLVYC